MKKVLVLAANPIETQRLRLDKEGRAIERSLRQSKYRDMYELHLKPVVKAKDLSSLIVEHKPHFIHFSGHSTDKGIVLENDLAEATIVPWNDLAEFFKPFSPIECILFNSCHSETQTETFAKHAHYVIGMSQEIGDEEAITFSEAFYEAVGNGYEIPNAFEIGRRVIGLAGGNLSDMELTLTLGIPIPRSRIQTNPSQNDDQDRQDIDEISGDEFVIQALRGNTGGWEEARKKYFIALRKNLNPKTATTIRLHRKLTMCYRKEGKLQLAQEEYTNAFNIKKELRHNGEVDISTEVAFLKLEYAYLCFSNKEWSALEHSAETIIESYDEDNIYKKKSEFDYILGNAFNLLAIALEYQKIKISKSGHKSIDCLKLAMYYLEKSNEPDTLQKLFDLEINLVARLLDEGSCDEVIARISNKFIKNDKINLLPIQRQILIKHNLAVAYLENQREGYISEAKTLAEQVLLWAKEQSDVDEWIWALELNLQIWIEQVRLAIVDDIDSVLTMAQNELEKLKFSEQFEQQKQSSQNRTDEIEFARLCTELYIAAKRPDKANEEFKKTNFHSHPSHDADMLVTYAQLCLLNGEVSRAEYSLEDAIRRYTAEEKKGKQVRTLAELASLHMNRGDWQESKKLLTDAKCVGEHIAHTNLKSKIATLLNDVNNQISRLTYS